FIVLNITGILRIGLDFCGCENLLRSRLFSATTVGPKTAATFCLLKMFHLLLTQSKVSRYEFYTSISRHTDNTG
ncbi:hypothetical protein POSPLADRAFT_1084439, partial [Postia placenta MAD-698-R-SB12]